MLYRLDRLLVCGNIDLLGDEEGLREREEERCWAVGRRTA